MPPYNDQQDKQNAKDALLAMAHQWRTAGFAVPDTSPYLAMIAEDSDRVSGEKSWEDKDEEQDEDEDEDEDGDEDEVEVVDEGEDKDGEVENDDEGESGNHEEDDKMLVFRRTPRNGIAAFALRDIPRGTRLLKEKSIFDLVVHNGEYDYIASFGAWKELPEEVHDDYAFLHPVQHTRLEILQKLIPHGKNGMYYVLADMIATLGAIYAANSFGDGVYKYASRINHSCTPNCNQSPTDLNEGEMRIHTVRDIKQGEELTVYYVDPEQPQQIRQRRLDDYEFLCKCPACDLTTLEGIRGERRRAQMWRLSQDIEFLKERFGLDGPTYVKGPFAPSIANRQGDPDPENALRVLESLHKKEGLVGNNLTER